MVLTAASARGRESLESFHSAVIVPELNKLSERFCFFVHGLEYSQAILFVRFLFLIIQGLDHSEELFARG